MATYGELSKFTHTELSQMHLEHEDLENFSFDELLKLAQLRLKKFQTKTPKDHYLKSIFSAVLVKATSDVLADSIKSVDWLPILRQIVEFFSNNS